jgi:peptidoglycan/xylan/chitin deacetylase (PgdA/CDA1 family)
MWRQSVKVGGARALAVAGLDLLLARLNGRSGRPLILAYHRVVRDYDPDPQRSLVPMQTSVAMLEAHLDWLGRRYRFVTLDEMGSCDPDRDEGRPLAAVTIDDGYRDAFDLAFPLLQRKGIPAALFVVTDLVEQAAPPLFDRLYYHLARGFGAEPRVRQVLLGTLHDLRVGRRTLAELQAAGDAYDALQVVLTALAQADLKLLLKSLEATSPMPADVARALSPVDWDMLRQMAKAGVVIGSHTRNHIFLTREPAAVVADELAQSKRALETHLGMPVRHFAYPAGEFDRSAVRAVARAGYEAAYTLCDHMDADHPSLTVPRTVFWEATCMDNGGQFAPALMQAQAAGIFEMVRPRCHLPHRRRCAS